MKKVLLFMVCALMGFALNAQVSDDFSDYELGGKIAQQAQAMGRDFWTTWSNNPGGSEDAIVDEIGDKQAGHFIGGGSIDQVMLFGGKTEGVWELSFKMWIPTGKAGYFNIQSKTPVNYNPNEWASQFYIGSNSTSGGAPAVLTPGVGTMDCGGQAAAEFTFQHDTWTDIKLIMDMNVDYAEILVNGNFVYSWIYTEGTFGSDSQNGGCIKQIDGMNIYPGESFSDCYITDIVFKESTERYSTSFDDVSSGSYVAQSYPEWWRTWENQPGTPQDALITNEQSSSTPNSAKCTYVTGDNGTDLVFKAGDKTSGTYKIDFDMYIPTGSNAYFNLLQNFDAAAPSNCVWAVGIYFNVSASPPYNPAGTFVQHNEQITNFTFPYATWFPISIFVNLDADFASIEINGEQILEWQYSITEDGDPGDTKLAAVDFYPSEAGSIFYIDNFAFAQQGAILPAPTLSVDTEEIVIEVKPGNIKDQTFHIVSEVENTQKATWTSYVDYAPIAIEAGPEFVLAHCDLYPSSVITFTGDGFDAEIAMRLRPEDYKEKLGGVLKQVAVYLETDRLPGGTQILFHVYGQGMAEFKQGEILATATLPLSSAQDGWNWVTITPAVQLTGGEYWVSTQMNIAANTALVIDEGPAVYGGDWIRTGENDSWGSWSRLSEGTNPLPYNWAIQVKGDGKVQKGWGTIDTPYGYTLGGAESEVKAIVNSNGMAEDTYTANIVILTNVEEYARFEIPLTMIVCESCKSNDVRVKEVFVDGKKADLQGEMYRVSIETTVQTAEIVVITEDENATVEGDGIQPLNPPNAMGMSTTDLIFTVIAEDGVTTKEYELRINAKIDTPAISEITNEMALYPNPVSDYLYIKTDVVIEQVTIYDLAGKVVKQVKQPANSIDLSELASGFYMLKANTPQGEMMQKFIKE